VHERALWCSVCICLAVVGSFFCTSNSCILAFLVSTSNRECRTRVNKTKTSMKCSITSFKKHVCGRKSLASARALLPKLSRLPAQLLSHTFVCLCFLVYVFEECWIWHTRALFEVIMLNMSYVVCVFKLRMLMINKY
jgi:hypothetical protein